MILSLYIRNYLLIDELEIQFSDGFTTITGETGAGKSILMGALSLILGQRVDTSVLKLKDAKCIVEGTFRADEGLQGVFGRHEVDYEPVSILRREVAPGGKSRAFINDTPVNLNALKEVGRHLVDIHSQHQNLRLSEHLYQMEVVDFLAKSETALDQYRNAFRTYSEASSELARVREEIGRMRGELEYMQHQHGELESAHLKEGELEDLEAEFQRAGHAEEIGQGLGHSAGLLWRESEGILDRVSEVLGHLKKISGYYSPASELAGRLEPVYIELKDLAGEVEDLAGRAEADPERLSRLQERIDLLYGLMQKHRVKETGELIAIRDRLAERIEAITFSEETIGRLEKQQAASLEELEKAAGKLHGVRAAAGRSMQEHVEGQLRELGIPHARFRVEVVRREQYDETGGDEIRFLFSANKQLPLEEVSKVASGGEISRLMLCIKALLSDRKGMPTLIFDEIDAGVGGEIAEKVGSIMEQLASGRQVVAITHLPQVASMGADHFTVFKEDTAHATYTRIRRLTGEERIHEIARMLSGESVTEAALSNARVLLRV